MNQKEKLLFKELCNYKSDLFDESLIEFATPYVLGQLFFNRMQGIAYDRLKKHNLLGKVNREFRNSLKSAYEQNLEKNQSFLKCITMVSEILSKSSCKYAMLKGALLCVQYPDGYRTSNDIDLLVSPQDVTSIGKLLASAGFRQGNMINDEFIPASREEIIRSKMLQGETVPYIREVNLPYMKYLEIDINFSLDYKNGNIDILTDMLNKTHIVRKHEIYIPTLSKEDFFIHLCAHLYKEATTLPWIEMHRDMTLYKYCDIYMSLFEMKDSDIEKVFIRARELDMEKICAYAILETSELFDISNKKAKNLSEKTLEKYPEFILQVVNPKDKKNLIYQTANTMERFFMENRILDLKEEKRDEKA